MARGVFDSQDQRYHRLYAFDNPMYSKVLVAWRSEHRKWIRNVCLECACRFVSPMRSASSR